MNVTEDVVKDLLPVYLAGEASADTVRLVDEFLADHPEMRGLAGATAVQEMPDVAIPENLERRSIELTRRLLARKNWLLGAATFLTILPLSFVVRDSKPVFFLYRDAPAIAALAVVAGLGCWVGYLSALRRLNDTGLQAPRSWAVRIGWYAAGCGVGAMFVLVGSHLGPGEAAIWRILRTAIPIIFGAVTAWLGERLNRVATIEDLHRPTRLFGE